MEVWRGRTRPQVKFTRQFQGNTELNCVYVGKTMPRELSHTAQSSSYGSLEHLLFQSTSSSTKTSNRLPAADVCFSEVALRQKQWQPRFQTIRMVSWEDKVRCDQPPLLSWALIWSTELGFLLWAVQIEVLCSSHFAPKWVSKLKRCNLANCWIRSLRKIMCKVHRTMFTC